MELGLENFQKPDPRASGSDVGRHIGVGLKIDEALSSHGSNCEMTHDNLPIGDFFALDAPKEWPRVSKVL